MYEAQKSTCYEWTSKEKFDYKEDIVVEMEELIMKKRIKTRKYWEKKPKSKRYERYECELWNAIEGINELKLYVNDDIKDLKEQCDIDNEDEGEKITAAITPMKKIKPVCMTFNQKFI